MVSSLSRSGVSVGNYNFGVIKAYDVNTYVKTYLMTRLDIRTNTFLFFLTVLHCGNKKTDC